MDNFPEDTRKYRRIYQYIGETPELSGGWGASHRRDRMAQHMEERPEDWDWWYGPHRRDWAPLWFRLRFGLACLGVLGLGALFGWWLL